MDTESKKKRGAPLREILGVLIILVVLTLLALPVVRNTMNVNLARTCQGNLKEWGAAFAMYRAENSRLNPPPHGYETYGPASNAAGCTNIDDAFDFAPDLRLIFPDYATDFMMLACPDVPGVVPARTLGPAVIWPPALDPSVFAIAHGSCADAGSITRPGAAYTYFGFEMQRADEEDFQISEAQAQRAGLPATGPANVVEFLEHFQVDADTTFEQAQPNRYKVYFRGPAVNALGWPYTQYFMIGQQNDGASVPGAGEALGIDHSATIAQYPSMPVMWDAIHQDASGDPVFNHSEPGGCNVLYMDGHVEFKTYPGVFPVSKSFATMKAIR